MIAYVSGTLVDKDPETALVDVDGIGYRVHVPTSTYQRLPDTGEEVTLHTYHYLREDDEALYGFATKAERTVFETMTGVSRVGPKLALSALSSMSPTELRDHVMEEDKSRLTEISGVGKKTADRLIVELRDPLADLDVFDDTAPLSGGSDARAQARADALDALTELGMSKADAERAIRRVLRDDAAIQSADELTQRALKESQE
ncbi:MAG: Holliday junction branch migration protein RuvA [Bacteroidetes bacterium QH_7_62_13]|nr:MAG: Holliday junction branch migration protein RuvA [Bacteroidetes bacterium QH_7_62_13]